MFHLTRQERIVLLSLAFVIFVGSITHYFFQNNPLVREILSFMESEQAYYRVNPNVAHFEQLRRVPYLGDRLAQQIIEYREQKGAFLDLEEIRWMKGVGPKKYERIRKFLTLTSP